MRYYRKTMFPPKRLRMADDAHKSPQVARSRLRSTKERAFPRFSFLMKLNSPEAFLFWRPQVFLPGTWWAMPPPEEFIRTTNKMGYIDSWNSNAGRTRRISKLHFLSREGCCFAFKKSFEIFDDMQIYLDYPVVFGNEDSYWNKKSPRLCFSGGDKIL